MDDSLWNTLPNVQPSRTTLILAALGLSTILLSVGLGFWSLAGIPHVQDELAYTLQSRIFVGGHRWAPADPAMTGFFWLSKPVSVAAFPPGWPLVLALGELVGLPWLVNPLLAGALAPLTFALGRALQLPERTALLAAAVIAWSPGVLLLAATRMSHTSVLVALLVAGVVVARRPTTALPWWGAGLALAYVVLARPFDAALFGPPLLVLGVVRARRWGLALLPGLAAVALLFDNAYITGDATTWPIDQWFAGVGLEGCNQLGFGEGVGCLGQHTPARALSAVWSNLRAFDRLLLGLPGGSLVLVLALVVERRRAWLLAPLALVAGGYALYWSVGLAYGARYWHAAYLTLPLLMGVGLERLLGSRTWAALPALSLWTLWSLGGLEKTWCVDAGLEEQLGDFRGVVVSLGHGNRPEANHPTLDLAGGDFICNVDLEQGDLVRLVHPLGNGPVSVRTSAASRPVLDSWLAEEHPGQPVLLAVHDVARDRRLLLDYATLDEPSADPDERVFQAWALLLLGDAQGARHRLEGLERPAELLSLARLHFLLGDLALTEQLVNLHLSEEDPGDPGALLLLANTYSAAGKPELGAQTFARAEAARTERLKD